jgi:hypothetical protein
LTGTKPRSENSSEPGPLDELDDLLEDNWEEESTTDINIQIHNLAPPPRSKDSSRKPEPSFTTKTVTALAIAFVALVELLRELGIIP